MDRFHREMVKGENAAVNHDWDLALQIFGSVKQEGQWLLVDPKTKCSVLAMEATAATASGALRRALKCYEGYLQLALEMGDVQAQLLAHGALASCVEALGESSRSQSSYEAYLRCAEELQAPV